MSYLELGGKRITIPVGAVGIGADPSSQVVLTGGPVLPHHAVIQGYADGQVAIRRATEEAEILVNGVRLGPQPTPLLHGDKVQVGQHELRFVDERRSGSTQYVAAVDPAMLAAMGPDGVISALTKRSAWERDSRWRPSSRGRMTRSG